jgi:hypothetical protein
MNTEDFYFKQETLPGDTVVDRGAWSDKMVPVVEYLEDLGFKVRSVDGWLNFIYVFSSRQEWYGGYTCEVRMNRHKVDAIRHSFSGAGTGIEGWSSHAFSGSVDTVKDLKRVLEYTGVDKRLKEWKKYNV